jgi:regulatory protein
MHPTDIITALQADPHDPDRVHVFVDGRHAIVLALDVAASERLSVGQPCPPERLERLHRAQQLNDIYESALRFLSYRPRSAREVEVRLRKKGYSPDQIDAVMQRLRSRGYVDDREFARFWVSNRMAFSPRGPRLLRSELRHKGVPPEIVEEVLAEQAEAQDELERQAAHGAEDTDTDVTDVTDEPVRGTDLANALALARRRMHAYGGLDPHVARRRLSGFLARRGYDYETISDVLRRLFTSDDDEEGNGDMG